MQNDPKPTPMVPGDTNARIDAATVAAGAPDSRLMIALLLGERLDHRRLVATVGGMTDPIQLARPDGLS